MMSQDSLNNTRWNRRLFVLDECLFYRQQELNNLLLKILIIIVDFISINASTQIQANLLLLLIEIFQLSLPFIEVSHQFLSLLNLFLRSLAFSHLILQSKSWVILTDVLFEFLD